MMERFRKLLSNEEGQGMAEYGLILALVAVACIAAFVLLKNGISNVLNNVGGHLENGA